MSTARVEPGHHAGWIAHFVEVARSKPASLGDLIRRETTIALVVYTSVAIVSAAGSILYGLAVY